MEMKQYSELASKTDLNTVIDGNEWLYYALGLVGESGEIANKLKKVFRDKNGQVDKEELISELGDVLWYLATLSNHLGYSLDDVAEKNLKKLQDRMARNKIHGSGDKR